MHFSIGQFKRQIHKSYSKDDWHQDLMIKMNFIYPIYSKNYVLFKRKIKHLFDLPGKIISNYKASVNSCPKVQVAFFFKYMYPSVKMKIFVLYNNKRNNNISTEVAGIKSSYNCLDLLGKTISSCGLQWKWRHLNLLCFNIWFTTCGVVVTVEFYLIDYFCVIFNSI